MAVTMAQKKETMLVYLMVMEKAQELAFHLVKMSAVVMEAEKGKASLAKVMEQQLGKEKAGMLDEPISRVTMSVE